MKKILIGTLLFAALQGRGQGFEGTVRWTMKLEITDPETKARMEQAERRMKDPGTEARIRQMQAQMNDPKFKEMMATNPQLKTQMENMLKAARGGDTNSLMPKGFTVKIKGHNTLTKMEGGMMDGQEVLHQKDKGLSFRLDRANKTYTPLTPGSGTQGTAGVKVTKTNETVKILDHLCTKYLAEVTEGDKPSTQIFWTTTDIRDFDLKNLSHQRMGDGPSLFYDQIEGVPLKIEMKVKQGNMTMEATEIKRESLNAGDFVIPSDFKELKMQ